MAGRYPQRVEDVACLAAAGDMAGLAEELLKTAIANGNRWDGDGELVLATVRGLPASERTVLAEALLKLGNPESGHQTVVNHLTLIGVVAEGLPGDLLSVARVRRLEVLGTAYCVWAGREAMTLVDAELAAGHAVPPATVAALRRTALVDHYAQEGMAGFVKKLTEPVLNPGEAWSDRALADLTDLTDRANLTDRADLADGPEGSDGPGGIWQELVRHAVGATSAKPSAAWEKKARALLDRLATAIAAATTDVESTPTTDVESTPATAVETATTTVTATPTAPIRDTLTGWLALVGRPRTQPFEGSAYAVAPNDEYDPYNADALRGLTWLLALLPPHPDTARALGALVEVSLRKIPGLGPRSPKVANAGVTALVRTEGDAALAELARLASRVTFKTTLKMINAGLEARADALGLSREEVEELAVPAYGLTDVGRAVRRLGDCEAELTVHGPKAALRWRNAAGKQVKAPPAEVKRDHPDELKELKAAVKDIDKMLSAQAERLDRQFLARREWPYAAWRERCLDHPLLGTLARRLLWTVDGTPCGFADGELRTLTGAPVTDGATVGLWHPVGRDTAEITAWRDWLERHGVTQPFKQAHREVYVLTDAERATGTYSNRFAAHILRQHQFNSLAAVRGWRNVLRLSVDDEYPPAVRELPRWGLRAEYWVEGVGGERWAEELTDAGSYLRVRTDQVRFYPIDAPHNTAHAGGGDYRMRLVDGSAPVDALPLTEIPPLVLSEVLRDVDLFVGVASVGNDPTWQDGGPEGRFREYWTAYGFGELGPSAATRRDLLARLVPRLAIADRCAIEGRFLRVRGDLHTYKIHLGSGNILRTPSDHYVCIVPSSTRASAADGSGTPGHLPFEGDRTLTVILSKAMLLAKDKEITDPTILSQL
ncbi:DUF4132 domain-containing protein [Streptomyces sp. NPDC087300]|uniref:DUF4132 domain-containing protein n=1 Tax=Streptomyces sp. NPDC087300 TaxID=3365780 RepID=UPI0038204866